MRQCLSHATNRHIYGTNAPFVQTNRIIASQIAFTLLHEHKILSIQNLTMQ